MKTSAQGKQDFFDLIEAYQEATGRLHYNHPLIINELIKVEPMPMPSGLLFYLDWPPKDGNDD